MTKHDLEFEMWYDILVDECRARGYDGPIDTDAVRMDYEEGCTPEESAAEFLEDKTY